MCAAILDDLAFLAAYYLGTRVAPSRAGSCAGWMTDNQNERRSPVTNSAHLKCVLAAALAITGAGLLSGEMLPRSAKAADAMPAATAKNANMDTIRGLVGTWEPVASADGKKMGTLVFKSTSANSVVMETMFPGSEHEMVNMYSADGDSVLFTHYCAMGNQPRMRLKSAADGVLKFEYVDGANLKSRDDPHMDSVELMIKGDRLTEKWSFYAGGKVTNVETFEFTRQK